MSNRFLIVLAGLAIVIVLAGLAIIVMLDVYGPPADLVVGITDEPPCLDPTTNPSASIDQLLNQNVYEGLVRATPAGKIVPALAKSFEISSNGLSYTFRLHEGIKFHDGSEFTARDVVATLERAMDPTGGSPHPEYYANIERIEAPDQHTVAIHLSQVDASFLTILALGDSVILPEEVPDTICSQSVGTGPFRFVEWVVGEHLQLEKNEFYYRQHVPLLDEVVFRFIPDSAAALASLLAGDVDMIARVPAEVAISVQGDNRFSVIAGMQNLVQLLAINNDRQPFSNRKVRQAIAYALDRDQIIEGAMFGYGEPIGSHFPPFGSYYVDLTDLYPHDPEKSRELLAEAGFPAGFDAKLTLTSRYDIHVRTGEIIADQLAKVGIDLDIELLEWGLWLSRVYSQVDYDLTVMGHIGKLDPAAILSNYGSGRENYYFRNGYSDSYLNELLEEGKRSTDIEQRHKLYAEAQRVIADDVVNYFIQDPHQIFIMKNEITGLDLYPIYLLNLTTVHRKR